MPKPTQTIDASSHIVVMSDSSTGDGADTHALADVAEVLPISSAIQAALDGKVNVGDAGVVGPIGPPGPTGADGAPGPTGPAGSAPVATYSAVTQTGGKTASVWSDSDITTITTSSDVVNANDDFVFTFSNSRFTKEKHSRITVMGTSHPFYYAAIITPLIGASEILVKNTSGSPMGEAIVLRVTIH